MNDNNSKISVLLCLLFFPLVFVSAQEIHPTQIAPGTEDSRCVEKNYRHKTAPQLARMTPEQLINESTKEWNYHVSLADKYGMFTLDTYTEKIGVKIIPVLNKLAENFRSRPNSECQQHRFFTAFAIASDVDNQIIRLRATSDGQIAISAAAAALQRMKDVGLSDPNTNPYNKYGFGLSLTTTLQGINENDKLIRELLFSEFKLLLTDQEFLSFVDYLTSVYPNYPSWAPNIYKYGLPGLKKNKKKYYDLYLQFKKSIQT